MIRPWIRSAIAGIAVLGLSGCGTIINGSSQLINVSSNPSGASISVDGIRNAQTPAYISLARKSGHALEITLDGYQPFQMQIQRGTSGWVWGNIVFGGLIGLVVDASTGGMYKLTPEQISAQLQRDGAEVSEVDDGVYVFVTLTPQEGWELVGWLDAE